MQAMLSWALDGVGGQQFNNNVFAFPPGHPFLAYMLKEFLALCPADLFYGQCGPRMLTDVYIAACGYERSVTGRAQARQVLCHSPQRVALPLLAAARGCMLTRLKPDRTAPGLVRAGRHAAMFRTGERFKHV
jgi:hypothetical protein